MAAQINLERKSSEVLLNWFQSQYQSSKNQGETKPRFKTLCINIA